MRPWRVLIALPTLALTGAGCVSFDTDKKTVNVNVEWNYGPALDQAAQALAEKIMNAPKLSLQLDIPDEPKAD